MSQRPAAGRWPLILALALGAVALLLSLVPNSRVWFHTIGPLHMWYHLGLFALLGLLAVRSSPRLSIRLSGLIFAAMLGFAIELGEVIRFDGIIMEWADIRSDILGIVLGAAAGWLLARRAAAGVEELED